MRYNNSELETLGSNPTTKFDKEGSLLLTERQKSFKTTEVKTLLWFKLRGNLLFYYKPKHSIPIGLYVLENCFPLILNEKSEPDGYAFFLEYHQDNPSRIRFYASTAKERREWFDLIKQSSHIYLNQQIKYLKEQIKEKKMGNRIECGIATNDTNLIYGVNNTNISLITFDGIENNDGTTTATATATATTTSSATTNYISKEGEDVDLIQF